MTPECQILYQDNALVAVCKPAGILSQDGGPHEPSMPALLRDALQSVGEPHEIYPVHRLDRLTSGVLLFARTPKAAAALSRSIAAQQWHKCYYAVLEGIPAAPQNTLTDLLYFDRQRDKGYVVKRPRQGVREARLTYRVLATLPQAPAAWYQAPQPGTTPPALSLLEVTPLTGRTHQIRLQFSSRGWPLCGDARYGAHCRRIPLALFAARLTVPHPITGHPVTFVSSPTLRGTAFGAFADHFATSDK